MRKAAIYLRVSTLDQTTVNQERELRAVAERMELDVTVYRDHGVSGAKGRGKRPEFDRLCKDAARRKFDVVMAWSVDRLGRSLPHLVEFLTEIHALKVDLYLHQQGLDTRTPYGKAMFGMASVFAELERTIIQERVRAGLRRAQATGTKSGKPIGRPTLDPEKTTLVRQALGEGQSYRAAAKFAGVSLATVQRIVAAARPFDGAEPVAA
jgi:DNA invertase Pin-like site-specific DNA recombinase